MGGGPNVVTERNTFEKDLQLPGLVAVDASTAYTANNFKITAAVDNVLGEAYWTGGHTFGRIFRGRRGRRS